MKLTLARDALAPALAALGRIVERKNTIPVLGNLLLRTVPAGLELTATDLDIKAETQIEAEVASDGALTLPAHTLADLVRKIPAGATITLEGDGKAATILRSGRSRFQLPTLPESDFPDISAGHFSHRFEMPATSLAGMIAATEFAICSDATRYYLCGIYWHALTTEAGERMHAVATDGHRLSRLEMPLPEGAAGMPAIIIPAKAVAQIAALAKDHKGDIAVEVSESKIRITAGPTTLTSKLIEGTFPDYRRVIPSGNDKRATIDADPFRQAIDRVSTLATATARTVRLSLADTGLTLAVTTPENGTATEDLSADYEGPPIDVGFNSRYLLDVLAVLGGDTVLLKLAEPGSPAILQSREGAALLVVLMPMRV